MEIPIRVTGKNSKALKTEGEGWSFVEDNPGTNNSLSKLKDLFEKEVEPWLYQHVKHLRHVKDYVGLTTSLQRQA